ncbi:MAG: carboxypeptidase regulatory-like domain-containing protein [Solidesulfovibrio sp. DCME]|uniref:carboxypeptidase regulatory-like domain-containing protein n=1 Tax=Solidesulfovibrio sp. DCME TaxID=3447380 RepID=UPI003D136204
MRQWTIILLFAFGLALGLPTQARAGTGSVSVHLTKADGGPMAAYAIRVFSGMTCVGPFVSGGTTDANGNCTIDALPEGEVFLQAWGTPTASSNYVSGWWHQGNIANPVCSNAQPVTVVSGQTASVDLILSPGGVITGNFADLQGNPIAGMTAQIKLAPVCSGYSAQVGNQTGSDASGDFTLYGVPSGNVYVSSAASPQYLMTWWDGSSGNRDCNAATPLFITAGQSTGPLHFLISPAGTVSGRVVDNHGNPVRYVNTRLYTGSPCGQYTFVAGTGTDSNGNYTISAPVGGPYYPFADGTWSGINLVPSWWNSSGGSNDCSTASTVNVTQGNDTPGVDFTLSPGAMLSGQLTDSQGAAITSATVRAYTGSACGSRKQVASIYTNTGSYTLYGVPPGNVVVQATSDQGQIPVWWDGVSGNNNCATAQTLSVVAEQTVSGLDMTLPAGGAISGAVHSSLGPSLANVSIYAYRLDGTSAAMTTTDSQGQYTLSGLAADTYTLYAYGGNGSLNFVGKWWDGGTGSLNFYQSQGTVVAAGATAAGRNFSLEPGGTLRGRITDQNGTAISGASVNAILYAPTALTVSLNGTSTDQNGDFSFKSMPATVFVYASYTAGGNSVSQWWDGSGGVFEPIKARPVSVPAGGTASGVIMQLPQGGTLTGTITDTSGMGLAGVTVTAEVETSCLSTNASQATTGADGSFSLSRIPTGKVHIAASGAGYYRKWWGGANGTVTYSKSGTVSVNPGQTVSGLGIKLSPGGSVTGTIKDSDGNPLRGIMVSALAGGACDVTTSFAQQTTNTAGVFTLSNLPPGTITIVGNAAPRRTSLAPLWWNGGTGTGNCANAQAVTIVAGQTTATGDMTMQPGGTIAGSLTTATGAPASCVAVKDTAGPACSGPYTRLVYSDYDGAYAIYGVPTGNNAIRTDVALTKRPFLDKYWDGKHGASTCGQAVAVPVASGQAVGGVDMTLSPLGQVAPEVGLLLGNGN